jgi:fructose-bisphosphate aldolase class II
MKQTFGVPLEEIVVGIKNGVRKVNIDTDNRMAITGAIRKALQSDPTQFDPRFYLKPAMEAMEKECIQRYELFNCAGQGSKIKPISLNDMASRYESGSLDPVLG